MKLHRVLTAAAAVLATTVVATDSDPAYSQTSYTYTAPAPGRIVDTGGATVVLSSDSESTIYGDADFTYTRTPDRNLFVTRILVSDIGGNYVIGTGVQVDCGRGAFRDVISPILYRNGRNLGSLSDVQINVWRSFDPNKATGQAMMRTCETAASDEGIIWSWF